MLYNSNSQNRLQRGHFTLKSSVLAPTAMSYMGQDFIANHMKSHYRRVLSAKAAVDTSPPKSMKTHIKVRDQKTRASLERSGAQSAHSLRRSPSLEFLSTSHNEQSPRSRPLSGRRQRAGTPIQRSPSMQSLNELHSTTIASSSPRTLSQHQLSVHYQKTPLSRLPPAPPVSPIRKETRQTNGTRQSRASKTPRTQRSLDKTETGILNHLDHNISTLLVRDSGLNETENRTEIMRGSGRTREAIEARSLETDEPMDFEQGTVRNAVPQLDLTDVSFSHRGPPSVRMNETDVKTKVWEEEQQYLRFISDVTTDVLARGIFSNRVLHQVFETHIERRKEYLDESRLRDMIDELKEDLGITDS